MGPGRWGALKDSGKIFFLSSQTSSLEENSRTPNARGRGVGGGGGGGAWLGGGGAGGVVISLSLP